MLKVLWAVAAVSMLPVLGACAHPATQDDARSSTSSAASGAAASSNSRSGVEFYGTLDVGVGSQRR